jgi:hypothetical protein
MKTMAKVSLCAVSAALVVSGCAGIDDKMKTAGIGAAIGCGVGALLGTGSLWNPPSNSAWHGAC